MKRLIFTIMTASFLFTVMSMPALAKSSMFDFTMKNRLVDGSKNGIYHSLTGGTYPTLEGDIYQTGGAIVNAGRNTIYAELRNKTSKNSFGEVILGRPDDKGKKVSFSRKFSKKTGGGNKYYLIFYRTESDGRIMSGEGTLSD